MSVLSPTRIAVISGLAGSSANSADHGRDASSGHRTIKVPAFCSATDWTGDNPRTHPRGTTWALESTEHRSVMVKTATDELEAMGLSLRHCLQIHSAIHFQGLQIVGF